jgi:hypothetical protein
MGTGMAIDMLILGALAEGVEAAAGTRSLATAEAAGAGANLGGSSVATGQRSVLLVGAENELEFANALELQARGAQVTVVNPIETEAAREFQSRGGTFIKGKVEDVPGAFQFVHENYPQPYVFGMESVQNAQARLTRVAPGGRLTIITENVELAERFESAAKLEGMTFSKTEMTTSLPASQYVPPEEKRYLLHMTRPQ